MIDEFTIQLANGTEEIENCIEKVKCYCRPIGDDDGGVPAFELYDQIPVMEDDELSVCDIWLANGIAAGIQQNHFTELWNKKEAIEKLLVSVPKGIGLESDDLEDTDGFDHLEQLLAEWMSMPDWKAARVTKVLHKKRPLLVPPIDADVMHLYSELRRLGKEGKRRWRYYPSEVDDVVEVIRRIRDDIRSEDNLARLKTIQGILDREGIQLSIVRIFDIILYKHLHQPDVDN
jgi:hypothetical protein